MHRRRAEPSAGASAEASAGSGSASSAGDAAVEAFDPEQVLIEQTLVAVDDPRDMVQVAVTALQVEDRVMLLELAVTPELASVSDSQPQRLFDLRSFFSRPLLFDRENLKRYEPVDDGAGTLYASDVLGTETVNGRAMRVYFYYAAPEDDIDAVDVVLSDSYPQFTDVPISR